MSKSWAMASNSGRLWSCFRELYSASKSDCFGSIRNLR